MFLSLLFLWMSSILWLFFLTSTSVWSTLEHVLASPSNYQIVQLDGLIQDLCQGDDTITIYL